MKRIIVLVGSLLLICQLIYSQVDTARIHAPEIDGSKINSSNNSSIQKKDSLQTKQMVLVKLLNGKSFEGEFVSSTDSTATYQSDLGFITINKLMIFSLQPIKSPSSSKIRETSPIKVALKICVDLGGSHKVSAISESGSLDVNTGISAALEAGIINESVFNAAFGIMYLIPREQKMSGSGTFNFVPLYTVFKFKLSQQEEKVIPIIIGNIGYDVIFNGDSDYKGPFTMSGGLYIAGGLRLETNAFFLEGLYKSFGGSASYKGLTIDVTYTTFSLAVGVLL